MPFQQPASSTIRQYHFRGKTYAFPVEASMDSASGGGHLHITVSDGYLLKTSLNESLQNQHTLDYVKQPDGSWLVRSEVTLVATFSALLSGTVILRSPQNEVLRIAISIEPSLYIDDSPIWFDETKPGKSTAALLTIRQQGAITPVSLQLDPTNAFTVADAKMAFISTSGFNLTPSFEGANLIISYSPNKSGSHNARLVVTTPYDTKIIPLIGQTGGLLSWLPKLSIPASLTMKSPLFTLPKQRRSHIVGVLAFSIVLSLIWGSYSLLSRSKNTVDIGVLAKQSARPVNQLILSASHETKQTSQPLQSEQPVEDEREDQKLTAYVQPDPTVLTSAKPIAQTKPRQLAQTKTGRPARPTPVEVDQVSDLEKELNSSDFHKDKP